MDIRNRSEVIRQTQQWKFRTAVTLSDKQIFSTKVRSLVKQLKRPNQTKPNQNKTKQSKPNQTQTKLN
jgi:hypothetical protein